MPQTMKPDYYSQSAQLAQLLRESGFSDSAEELEGIIAAGCTSTEILMGIRHHLRAFIRKPLDLGAAVRNRINDLITAIDDVV